MLEFLRVKILPLFTLPTFGFRVIKMMCSWKSAVVFFYVESSSGSVEPSCPVSLRPSLMLEFLKVKNRLLFTLSMFGLCVLKRMYSWKSSSCSSYLLRPRNVASFPPLDRLCFPYL